jgi:hypothetical protein
MPAPGEEGRESLVVGWLEADGKEPGLEPFGEVAEVEVGGDEERMGGGHPVEHGEQQVLGVAGAAVEFVGYRRRVRAAIPAPRRV